MRKGIEEECPVSVFPQRDSGWCELSDTGSGLSLPSRKEEHRIRPVEPSRDCCVKA